MLLAWVPAAASAQEPRVSCASLGSQEAAEQAVSVDPSLLPLLDRDGDGVPCESGVPSPSQLGVYIVVGAVLVGVGSLALLGLQRRKSRSEEETLEARVARLQGSLTDAAGVVAEIEREVASRQELLAKLEEDARRVRALTGMDSAEVDAVTQALNGQLAQLEKRSLRGSIVLSSIFYVLGIVSGVLTNIFVS
ncbi:hypothetical protein [Pseudonocardia pini]|uniref:hypothetical protein n=1 Tax=Pseudonocardia pini TaxID=2758030 RepID=UPI0015F08311|nr:hypothetical protein [Pseudonocardia pini]